MHPFFSFTDVLVMAMPCEIVPLLCGPAALKLLDAHSILTSSAYLCTKSDLSLGGTAASLRRRAVSPAANGSAGPVSISPAIAGRKIGMVGGGQKAGSAIKATFKKGSRVKEKLNKSTQGLSGTVTQPAEIRGKSMKEKRVKSMAPPPLGLGGQASGGGRKENGVSVMEYLQMEKQRPVDPEGSLVSDVNGNFLRNPQPRVSDRTVLRDSNISRYEVCRGE